MWIVPSEYSCKNAAHPPFMFSPSAPDTLTVKGTPVCPHCLHEFFETNGMFAKPVVGLVEDYGKEHVMVAHKCDNCLYDKYMTPDQAKKEVCPSCESGTMVLNENMTSDTVNLQHGERYHLDIGLTVESGTQLSINKDSIRGSRER